MKKIKDKLIEEYIAAIVAVLGDNANEIYQTGSICSGDIDAISKKVKWYLDLI